MGTRDISWCEAVFNMEPNFSRAGNALSMLQDPTLSPTSKSRGFAQIDPSLLLKLPKHTALGGPQVVPRTAGEPEVLLPEEPARQMRDAAQPHVLRAVNAEIEAERQLRQKLQRRLETVNHEHKLQQQSTLAAQLAAEKASSSSAAAVAHATTELRLRMEAEQEQAA